MSDTSTSAGVKSTTIHTSVNIFEVSKRDKSPYFVDKVKDKRRTKNNNLEFLIGWCDNGDNMVKGWNSLGCLDHTIERSVMKLWNDVQVKSFHNQTFFLTVTHSPRPTVVFTPTTTPCSHPSLSHTHRSMGFFRNQTFASRLLTSSLSLGVSSKLERCLVRPNFYF